MPSKAKKTSATHTTTSTQINNPPRLAPPATTHFTTEHTTTTVDNTNGTSLNSQPESESRTGDTTESAGEPMPVTATNRKKQKRREKEAAKRLVDSQLSNGHTPEVYSVQNGHLSAVKQGRGPVKGYFTEETDYIDEGFQDSLAEADEAFYSGDDDEADYEHEYAEGAENSWLNTSKRKKGSKKRSQHNHDPGSRATPGIVRSSLPALSNAAIRSAHKISNEHIWNTSTQAERENIKQFWLELGEEERRSLVKVEKEAVLRKMKEQQKHSCSCSVCGRKRTAIEEELEVLYDAYYEELEQFANHDNNIPDQPHVIPPPRGYRTLRGQAHPMAGAYPVQGRVRELGEDGEELDDDDDYDDEDEDEPYSDEEYEDELPPGPPDFFQFGNSLTVKDGILTVADDLLKNDGKHFIDMMEQLAERRMQREEEIHYPVPPLAHHDIRQGHNHPPIDEEDDYDDDEEDDDDYDSQEEDDFEGDEMDSMTEEQRMEEGRRMFQIFAARMFEQRVLTAYREKVAAERQRKLLEELDEETRLDTQKEAKKAKEAAKKKEKKARQKAAKEEEKAKKDAEKAAQEAAARELEERRLAEQKARKEEQRKKRDAEKKVAEDEKIRKEAEKLQRAQKERDRQAEVERKSREAREREKKQKDEARRKEREEREIKEKEIREQKLKEEKDRKSKEDQSRKESISKVEKDGRDRTRSDHSSRPQPVALPPGLHAPARPPQLQSPHFPIATPTLPSNIPTPGRNRQTSQPSQSHTSSPPSQKEGTEILQSTPSPAVTQAPAVNQTVKPPAHAPMLHHPQPSVPRSPLHNIGRGGQFPFNMNGMSGLGVNGPPATTSSMLSSIGAPMPMYQGPPMGGNPRFGPNGLNYPPGFGAPRPYQPVQQMPYQYPVSNTGPPLPSTIPATNPPSHSRQASAGTEQNLPQAPIGRPGPIARPSSTTPDRQRSNPKSPSADVEQITTQLGSKALLDDSDEPLLNQMDSRSGLPPVGAPGTGRLPFASSFPSDKGNGFGLGHANWGGFNSAMAGGNWGPPNQSRPNPGWSQPPFAPMSGQGNMGRMHAPRPIAVRLMLVQACRQLSAMAGTHSDGLYPVATVLRQLEQLKPPGEASVSMQEMLGICDTEGNVQNGGGSFEVIIDHTRGQVVKFVEGLESSLTRSSVGDIGSPLSMAGHHPAPLFGSIGQGVQQGFGPPGRSF